MANDANSAPTLLELDTASVKVIEGKASKGLRFHRVSLDGKAPRFLLHPIGTFSTVPWRPSIFGGDGTEQRLNVQIKVTDEQREAIENLEDHIRTELDIHPSSWNSIVKPTDDGGLLKAKLNLAGPKTTMTSGEATTLPDDWPRQANMFITLGCVYQQMKASGLLLEITALEICQQQKTKTWNPFQRK